MNPCIEQLRVLSWIDDFCHFQPSAVQDAVSGPSPDLCFHSSSDQEFADSSQPCTSRVAWNRVEVDMDLVKHLIMMGFTVPKISAMLNVAERTLKRRLQENNIRMRAKYSQISDADLDSKILDILNRFPTIGLRNVYGHLLSGSIWVQYERLYGSYKRVMLGIGNPLRRVIYRRKYYVRAPLSLWHIDGNHKLIRWKLVIHGGIDGYSRLVVYLTISTNNLSSTVYDSFMGGVKEYGCPSRLRIDGGGENARVANYMVQTRGIGRGSVISGKSVHNNRIERLWRDVFESCTGPFYKIFYQMEDQGILDIDNESDIFCLHFVATNLLQRSLSGFRLAWNNHRLRTEKNMSPNMLYTSGLALLSAMRDENSPDEFTELVQDVQHSTDPNESNSGESECIDVQREVDVDGTGNVYEPPLVIRHHTEVPLYRCPLNEAGIAVLQSQVDPQKVELANLVDTFIHVKTCVAALMLA